MPSSPEHEFATKPILYALKNIGMEVVDGTDLTRDDSDVFVWKDVFAALQRLNPMWDAKWEVSVKRVLENAVAEVKGEGVIIAGKNMEVILKGNHMFELSGLPHSQAGLHLQFIDFDNPENNHWVASTETRYRATHDRRVRFDVIIWCNGIPLVVIECKRPDKDLVWKDAAWQITGLEHPTEPITGYVERVPEFFVPNLFCIASEGLEVRYGAPHSDGALWKDWKSDSLALSIEQLCSPLQLLDMLRFYTLVRHKKDYAPEKIIARQPQIEAVDAIVKRALDETKNKGLLWHYQGSGKTLIILMAARRLEKQNPGGSHIVVLDRQELIVQTRKEFTDCGVTNIFDTHQQEGQGAKKALREYLESDGRGIILTSAQAFQGVEEVLCERNNIVVLVDEAHRSQDGELGEAMRAHALPNATWIGATGTPINNTARNTYATFGDSTDKASILHAYSPEESLADEVTVPIEVMERSIDFILRNEDLDRAFDDLAKEKRLDDFKKNLLAEKAATKGTLNVLPAYVNTVLDDVLDDYMSNVHINGLKAQLVVPNRSACVVYHEILTEKIRVRELDIESAIVMTSNNTDPKHWKDYAPDYTTEETLKNRFRNESDPLCIFISTDKLLTGFDAKICGAMYLIKSIKSPHTLSQAVARTNRSFTTKKGYVKQSGVIVDYSGQAAAIKESFKLPSPDSKTGSVDQDELAKECAVRVQQLWKPFRRIDVDKLEAWQVLDEATRMIREGKGEKYFLKEFSIIRNLFERLHSKKYVAATDFKEQYSQLSVIYSKLKPHASSGSILWKEHGAKTLAIIQENLGDITIHYLDEIKPYTADEIEALRKIGVPVNEKDVSEETVQTIIDNLTIRIQARLNAGTTPERYKSLSVRLERLRAHSTDGPAALNILRDALGIARDLVKAEHDEGVRVVGVPMLSQVMKEYAPEATPDIIRETVEQIEDLVQESRYEGWQENNDTQREVRNNIKVILRKNGMANRKGLFEKVYEYVFSYEVAT